MRCDGHSPWADRSPSGFLRNRLRGFWPFPPPPLADPVRQTRFVFHLHHKHQCAVNVCDGEYRLILSDRELWHL